MHISLAGKTALVTGSTSGIGRGIAKGLAEAGARVILNGRSQSSLDAAAETLRQEVAGAQIIAVAADVGTAEGCESLVDAVGSVDILVNNAGIFALQDFFEIPDSEWQRFFEVNVMSGIRLARALTPGMIERNWGRVVFISSESALNIPDEMIHYGFTKTANLAVSRGLAKRLRGTKVTVNAVLPGPTLTEGVEELIASIAREQGRSEDEVKAGFVPEHRPSSILQRLASVEEVANMVVYVCSPQASATTGAALRVDGGTVDTIA
ncbi:NAD(P)-dependent dehydrogenase (short-subunit alcohol dehydrogenase family) [Rhodoligotrophos appendicifer]|uniref:SDR family NAD(P)-dependent oxidoreductase n=1 Tax=Rhodoligotrophos appendicifer TaxID=987056 RepID=UPI001185147C|nr:SDR family oxidoreductase [Rhodoligotrophos appendicifer]